MYLFLLHFYLTKIIWVKNYLINCTFAVIKINYICKRIRKKKDFSEHLDCKKYELCVLLHLESNIRTSVQMGGGSMMMWECFAASEHGFCVVTERKFSP